MTEEKKILRKILSVEDHPSTDAKYVRVVRGSNLARWFALWSSQPVEKMPVPTARAVEARLICELVDELREAKAAGEDAGNIEDIGEEIEWRVSELYGLTYEEELIISDTFHKGGMSMREKDARMVAWIESDMADECPIEEDAMEFLRNPSAD